MSEHTPDNPLAFPFQGQAGSGFMVPDYGMTLRDWFAGQALTGLLAGILADGTRFMPGDDLRAAENAYLTADAMLQARSKGEV